MTWLSLLKYALQIVAYLARRSERFETEKAALDELENLQRTRVDKAAAARDASVSGGLPDNGNDPYNRDGPSHRS